MAAGHRCLILSAYALSTKRISIAAHCALVAEPCGSSAVSVTPVIIPSPTAQAMARAAQSLTLAASVKPSRLAAVSGSPAKR